MMFYCDKNGTYASLAILAPGNSAVMPVFRLNPSQIGLVQRTLPALSLLAGLCTGLLAAWRVGMIVGIFHLDTDDREINLLICSTLPAATAVYIQTILFMWIRFTPDSRLSSATILPQDLRMLRIPSLIFYANFVFGILSMLFALSALPTQISPVRGWAQPDLLMAGRSGFVMLLGGSVIMLIFCASRILLIHQRTS